RHALAVFDKPARDNAADACGAANNEHMRTLRHSVIARALAGKIEAKTPPPSVNAAFLSITLSSPIGLRLRRHKRMSRSASAEEPTIGSLEPGMYSPRLCGLSSMTQSMASATPSTLTKVHAR